MDIPEDPWDLKKPRSATARPVLLSVLTLEHVQHALGNYETPGDIDESEKH